MKLLHVFLALVLVTSPVAAGPSGGPMMAPGELGPGIGFSYTLELKPKENTSFHVMVKEGEGDVDCDLLDDKGELVSRVTEGRGCKILFQPPKKAKYTFIVKNESEDKRAKFVALFQ